jgi:ABC-2 type transport system ATP-binding protein
MSAGPVLEVEGLRKSYGSNLALDGIDLSLEPGTILALLGPNGAGKTTLVSIIAGLRRADAGQVRVGGIDVDKDPHAARQLLGLAPQETGVYLTLTVRDNLRFFAGLAGLRRRELVDRIDDVAAALGLTSLLSRRAAELSGGERRRLHTAIALVHRPPLVLLDEPTTGADVRTRSEILALVRRLAEGGSAVVYSTHYLHEVEELDAFVAIIDRGRVVARGPLRQLMADHASSALELTFDGPVPDVVRVQGAVVEGSVVRIPTPDPAASAAQLLPQLASTDALSSIEVLRPNLEAVFLEVTGRRYAEDHTDAAA